MKYATILTLLIISNVYAETKSYDSKNIKLIEVSSPKGEIKIKNSDSSKIEIGVDKIQFDPKCRMSFSEVGTTLKIVIDQENMIFDKANCITKIDVKSPKEIPLTISTGTSSVFVENIISEINFKSATGAFLGTGLESNFSGTTATGSMTLKYSKCPERADIELLSASSDAEVSLPKNCKIKASHKSATGELYNEIGESKDYKVKVTMKSASGSLKILKATK